MSMKRILFVDDESAVLDGLRHLLRRERGRWETVFALGGPAGLAELERGAFDVVVSDLHMPQVDGIALLKAVRDKHPACARLILSGQPQRARVVQAMSVAHQVLSKPCNVEVLREVIERTCSLQSLLQNEAVRGVVGRADVLPSLPKVYAELTAAIRSQGASLATVSEIVAKDPQIAARILQLVNSAYFGLERRVTSIREAVTYLGIDTIKGLALTAHVFQSAQDASPRAELLERFQRSSMACARLAKWFVSDESQREEAFTAAIVRDVGRVVLANAFPDTVAEIARLVRDTKRSTFTVEQEQLGVSHAEVGAYLLGVWGLPHSIVAVVAHHHIPTRAPEELREIVAAVHAADALVDAPLDMASSECELDLAFLDAAGLIKELPRWRELAEAELRWLKAG
jgi:HD-like signal output (HDOD) protein